MIRTVLFLIVTLSAVVYFAFTSNVFDVSFNAIFGNTIPELISLGLLTKSENNIKLTDHGRLLCNQVTRKFLETLSMDKIQI